jgi:hypothetical protein
MPRNSLPRIAKVSVATIRDILNRYATGRLIFAASFISEPVQNRHLSSAGSIHSRRKSGPNSTSARLDPVPLPSLSQENLCQIRFNSRWRFTLIDVELRKQFKILSRYRCSPDFTPKYFLNCRIAWSDHFKGAF